MYRPVNPGVTEALRRIVGQDNVLIHAEAMEPYTHDETVAMVSAAEPCPFREALSSRWKR